jgi:hypothetical protein
LTPNSFTCAGVLISTAGLQSLVLGQSIHGPDVKTGLESDIIVGTTMLDKYAKCGSMIDSYKVFQLLTFSLQFSRILARLVGLRVLFGSKAFPILNIAQAVPIACPAASKPSFVTCAACSPYLQ